MVYSQRQIFLKKKKKKTREAKLWVMLEKEKAVSESCVKVTQVRGMVQLNPNFLVTCYIDTEDLCRMWPLRSPKVFKDLQEL